MFATNRCLTNLLFAVLKLNNDELYLKKLIQLLDNVPNNRPNYKQFYTDNNYDKFYRSLGLEILNMNSNQNEKAIIGVLNSKQFLQSIYKPIIQNNFPYNIKSIFWIAMSKSEFQRLIAIPECGLSQYTSNSVLFQSFFNWEILMETQTCLKEKSKKIETVNLVKISAKIHQFQNIEENEDYFYFVKYLMLRRKNAIIPKLECWIPGIGAKLITENLINKRLNVWTRIGDLTPDEIYAIFKFIYHCPDYNECTFKELVRF